MIKKNTLLIIVILAFTALACRVSFNVPMQQVTTGQTQVEEINIPAPDVPTVDLQIDFDAGQLNLSPGADPALVTGTATYNFPAFKPEVEVQGSEVRLSTGEFALKSVPRLDDTQLRNEWDLQLGSQQMALTLDAGAYEGELELGGLALRAFYSTNGAAQVDLNFSQPNPVEMSMLQYQTGASGTKLTGLGNANFATMIFRGGAGDYELDFSGALRRDASVVIEAGIGQVTIVVPDGVPAEVVFQGGLSNVNASSEWEKSGMIYTQPGSGPGLTITVNMGAGSLTLR